MNQFDDQKALENRNNYLKKDYEEKKRIELDYIDQLIYLINKEAIRHYQLLQKQVEKQGFEKNISHALTLLAAAREQIKNDKPPALTDYLITSALSRIAKSLPEKSVSNIYDQLTDLNNSKNNSRTTAVEKPNTEKPSKDSDVSKSASGTTTPNSTDNLIACVKAKLFADKKDEPAMIDDKQIIIDFCADSDHFKTYSNKRAELLHAKLIQTLPDQRFAENPKFSISQGTTLTFIGHCTRGSDYLVSDTGIQIYASEIAEQIFSNMSRTNTPLDTAFKIDLISCLAGAGEPSFAKILVEELAKYGINNIDVIASPTIMLLTPDGTQANLSFSDQQKDDEKRELELKLQLKLQEENCVTRFFRQFFFSHERGDENIDLKLNAEKIVFHGSRKQQGF